MISYQKFVFKEFLYVFDLQLKYFYGRFESFNKRKNIRNVIHSPAG
jgi:hypothetical protein